MCYITINELFFIRRHIRMVEAWDLNASILFCITRRKNDSIILGC
jgi:hypothetical protein